MNTKLVYKKISSQSPHANPYLQYLSIKSSLSFLLNIQILTSLWTSYSHCTFIHLVIQTIAANITKDLFIYFHFGSVSHFTTCLGQISFYSIVHTPIKQENEAHRHDECPTAQSVMDEVLRKTSDTR